MCPGHCSVRYVYDYSIQSCTPATDNRSLLPLSRFAMQGRYIPDLYDLYDLYDLAHVAGWEPYSLHDLQ